MYYNTKRYIIVLLFSLEVDALTQHSFRNRHQDLSQHETRRSFLDKFVTTTTVGASLISPRVALAIGEGSERMVFNKKPTAPIGALLPAVQQRLLLEAAIDSAKKNDQTKLKKILAPLDDSYIPNMNGSQNMKVIKQFNPSQVLRGDLIRATMNLYQTNLNYNSLMSNNNPSEAFTVTDATWKKSYIRANDGLPDIQKLIGADIDMRQLLRNQVQEKIDDASAELYTSNDSQEVLTLLQDAAQNFDQWLDRVRYGDVRDAIQAAMAGEQIQIYNDYAAGFLPPKPRETP